MAKSRGSKGSKGSDNLPTPAGAVKLKLTLSAETIHRLKLEAFGRRCSVGAVVEDLVASSPRRFSLVNRGVKGPGVIEAPPERLGPGLQEAQGAARPLSLLSDAG